MKIGRDPLLDFLLNGYEPCAHLGMSAVDRTNGRGPFAQSPVTANQPCYAARSGVTDRSYDGFDISSGSAESKAMMDPYLSTFGQTRMEDFVQGTRIFPAQAVGNRRLPDLFR